MRIIKRKRNGKPYFYLQYSYRKGNKVITKEKYLGKDIPKNIEKIKQYVNKEEKIEIYKKLEKIRDNFQKAWVKLPYSIQQKILENVGIRFTYNTNAIEGSTINLNEAEQIIKYKIAPNKPIRDVKETENHQKVYLEIVNKKEKISNKLILRWHKEVFQETKQDIAGKYRNYLVAISGYIAPDWRKIKKLMNNLIKFINSSKLNAIELAAHAHYRFEIVHPFGDGNGRVGRLLMNHIIWHNKYPLLMIEYKKRQQYYKALQRGEEKFVTYFLKKYINAHKKLLKGPVAQ